VYDAGVFNKENGTRADVFLVVEVCSTTLHWTVVIVEKVDNLKSERHRRFVMTTVVTYRCVVIKMSFFLSVFNVKAFMQMVHGPSKL